MGKLKLAALALLTMVGIGCGSSKHYQPIEHYFGAGIGTIMPGSGEQQDMPSVTAGEFDYRAQINENWSAGMSMNFGKGSKSKPADIPNNIPSTDSTMDTNILTPYVQWQKKLGKSKRNELSVKAGISFIDQDRHATIGAPINNHIHLAGNTVGGTIGAKYQYWNQAEDTSFYVQIKADFSNGENITNTATATTGVEFKLKEKK